MADTPLLRKDFKILADLRVEEARILLARGKQQRAYYLAGYAVECALKACIAKKTRMYQFPPKRNYVERVYRHDLDELVTAAGLDGQLKKDIDANAAFAANWATVKDWSAESRYKVSGLNGKDMYNAVVGKDGVFQWIKLRW